MLVLGINTGTSVDGVDMALVKWNNVCSLRDFKIIQSISYQFDPMVKHDIEIMIGLQKATLEDLSNLNYKYSQFIAALVDEFQKDLQRDDKDLKIDLLGVHGQTIFHGSKSTLQLGNASVIATLTGIPTVNDFRSADMAVGGCGAPLTSFFDDQIIRVPGETRGTLNIGGIANISVMQPERRTIAYDTGPGNTLIDHLMQKLFQKPFDDNGKMASKGKVNYDFIESQIKRTEYFSMPSPKATGRELFDEKYADKFLDLGNKENIIATATYFTAKTISMELAKFPLKKVFVSGGGTKNNFLMQNLRQLNPETEFVTHDNFGVKSQYKEAILFSMLAYTNYLGMFNNIPSATGAKKPVVLGVLAKPYANIDSEDNSAKCQTQKTFHSQK